MDRYMERRLTSLHEAGTTSKFKEKFIIFIVGFVTVVLLPYIHIGIIYRYWTSDKPPVDRAKCSCGCFDTVFRGRYESPPSAYKHVYFNATSNTLKMWIITVLGVLTMYECMRYLLPLFWHKRLRIPMFLVFLSAIYPHYYGWWNMLNYLNEDFFVQWYHQLFFTVTEVLSTAMVIHLCNRDNKMESWKLLIILNINLMHIIVASVDQFIGNIFYHQAVGFEAVRDIALMMPDVFHVLLPFFELQALAKRKCLPLYGLFYKEELMLSFLFLVLISLLGKHM